MEQQQFTIGFEMASLTFTHSSAWKEKYPVIQHIGGLPVAVAFIEGEIWFVTYRMGDTQKGRVFEAEDWSLPLGEQVSSYIQNRYKCKQGEHTPAMWADKVKAILTPGCHRRFEPTTLRVRGVSPAKIAAQGPSINPPTELILNLSGHWYLTSKSETRSDPECLSYLDQDHPSRFVQVRIGKRFFRGSIIGRPMVGPFPYLLSFVDLYNYSVSNIIRDTNAALKGYFGGLIGDDYEVKIHLDGVWHS